MNVGNHSTHRVKVKFGLDSDIVKNVKIKMRKTHKISQEQEEGLRRLIIWLSSYHHDTAVFVNNKFREITYFSDIISKVVVLGEYTDDEKQTLNEL